jgi:hypothetical protein
MFPPIEQANAWVHHIAQILANHEHLTGREVRARMLRWLADLQAQKAQLDPQQAKVIDHVVKTTRSFAPGLFHCYHVPDLPATNNDLEQCFGSVRYHERRTTGRKATVPALVVRGSVRIVATVATKTRLFSAQDLRPRDPHQWQDLRQQLSYREHTRCQQRRFRKDPAAYLAHIQARLLTHEAAPP